MSRLSFYLRTALNNLRRGGQRIWVALLCIAFGVMSLEGMTQLSQSIARTMLMEPRHRFGGDLSLGRALEDVILPEHEAELRALQESGEIQDYLLIAQNFNLVFSFPGSGEVHFEAGGYGIDPQKYPLAGSFVVSKPGNIGPESLLQSPEDVLVTRDIADDYDLQVGDPIRLSDYETGAVAEGVVRGIVSDTPNHQGSKIYYTLAMAERLAGGRRAVNVAVALADDPEHPAERLNESGWFVTTAQAVDRNEKRMSDFVDMSLKGAGILGLLVGGIGIANTMQVLLRRRRKEIAVWKTLGYRNAELVALFSTEAALLGAAGSLLGAGLGILISVGLVDLFQNTGNILLEWRFQPLTILSSFLVGLLTTVVFALWSILIASRVPPLALLRQEALNRADLPWAQSLALAAGLGLPFLALTSLVMGSLLKGLGVLLFALLGLVLLGAVLGGLTWAAARLLALISPPTVRSAYTSMRRRGLSLVFATIALFAGVVSLALGTVVTQNAGREMDERQIDLDGYNLHVVAPLNQEPEIRRLLEAQGDVRFTAGLEAPVRSVEVLGIEGFPAQAVLVGREDPHEYNLFGAPWGSRPEGVYIQALGDLSNVEQVEVTLEDGSVRLLEVIGSYEVAWSPATLPPSTGVLMPNSLLEELTQPETVRFFIEALPGRVQQVSAALGEGLPEATVINLVAYAGRLTQAYKNLFLLAVAMASLALLAGVLLATNSVSLAMLDRRYEIGVFKALGYSRGQVLFSLVLEYILLALVASGAGLAVVQVFLWLMARANNLAAELLVMPPLTALLIGLVGVGLALLAVLGVTWGPTSVSPAVVLNDRE